MTAIYRHIQSFGSRKHFLNTISSFIYFVFMRVIGIGLILCFIVSHFAY